MKTFVKNLTPKQLEEFFVAMGEKPFRGRQVMQWLYNKRASSVEEMTNISAALRTKLDGAADLKKLPIVTKQESADGTAVKLALELPGGKREVVECVVLFDGKRNTACLSTQLGCKYGCVYCNTARMGFRRNLTQREILEQLIALQDHAGTRRITNVVFMGMGEPLDNLKAVLAAVEIIQSDHGFVVGGRKITISTCGLVPQIRELADVGLNLGLAVSLNAPNDEIRNRLVPINRKYPIAELLKASKYYCEKVGRRVTFEYVLIEGVTARDKHLEELKQVLGGFPCKLNLIGYNERPESEFKCPSGKRIREIVESLEQWKYTVTLRKSLGRDIAGACGQLYSEIQKSAV